MVKSRENKPDLVPCPHPACKDRFHPPGSGYCPNSGERLPSPFSSLNTTAGEDRNNPFVVKLIDTLTQFKHNNKKGWKHLYICGSLPDKIINNAVKKCRLPENESKKIPAVLDLTAFGSGSSFLVFRHEAIYVHNSRTSYKPGTWEISYKDLKSATIELYGKFDVLVKPSGQTHRYINVAVLWNSRKQKLQLIDMLTAAGRLVDKTDTQNKMKKNKVKKKNQKEKMMKNRKVDILAFVLLLFSVFYSVNSDIINENDNDILYPITYILKKKANQATMEQLIGPPPSREEKRKCIYLLVLDRSLSLTWKGDFPAWYNDTINTLNRRTDIRFDRYIDSRGGSELCKINLFQVLLDIENQHAEFAVLKLGDLTTKLYPVERNIMSCEANTGNILDAISHIERTTNDNEELNTDFKCLFTKIHENYINSLSRTNHPDGLPLVKLIVISDLIHDVKDKLEKELKNKQRYTHNQLKRSLEDDKIQLIKQIRQLLKSQLLVNIVITRGAQERELAAHEVYTWEFLDNKNRNFPPQKIPIERYSYLSLLYSVKAEGKIVFYHKGDTYIQSKTTFVIANDRPGDYKFSLDIPRTNSAHPRGEMKFQILDSGGTPIKGKSGYLDFNGALAEIKEVGASHFIRLSYSRELPPWDRLSILNIYPPREKRKFFSVPFSFKKKFTTFNVAFILLLYLYIILYFVYYLFHYRNLYFLVQVSKGIFFQIKKLFG